MLRPRAFLITHGIHPNVADKRDRALYVVLCSILDRIDDIEDQLEEKSDFKSPAPRRT